MLEITLNSDHKAMPDESAKLRWSFCCGSFSCCCFVYVLFLMNTLTRKKSGGGGDSQCRDL